MNDAVRISVLGPMEVHGPSGPTPVAGIRLQSVLAMLALAAPHPVSTDRLLEGVWGDDQPAKPANALQALISHLRRLTGGDIVARRGAGYVLTCEPDEIDVARLEDLVHRGRSKSAAGDYREAADCFAAGVELHRGTPLGQLADLPFARAATPRLEDLIVTAHEGWAECGLATGRHEEVVDALTALVAEHPDREQLRAQLMTALYRCGRQRDALAVYDDARRHLRDEYGLDPGPALQALERAVLAHDPALAAPIALTPQIALGGPLPAPLTSFVGRTRRARRARCDDRVRPAHERPRACRGRQDAPRPGARRRPGSESTARARRARPGRRSGRRSRGDRHRGRRLRRQGGRWFDGGPGRASGRTDRRPGGRGHPGQLRAPHRPGGRRRRLPPQRVPQPPHRGDEPSAPRARRRAAVQPRPTGRARRRPALRRSGPSRPRPLRRHRTGRGRRRRLPPARRSPAGHRARGGAHEDPHAGGDLGAPEEPLHPAATGRASG